MRIPVLAAVLLLAATACGTRSTDDPDEQAAAGEWRVERLTGEPSVDAPTVFVSDGTTPWRCSSRTRACCNRT